MGWRDVGDEADLLVRDCQAMIVGRSAEVLAGAGHRVPPWAWVNFLAHGTEDDLRAMAADRPPGTGWLEAQGYLATEILRLLDAGHISLESFQREVLVPLELDVLGLGLADAPTPACVVLRVMAAVESARVRPRS